MDNYLMILQAVVVLQLSANSTTLGILIDTWPFAV
jgi:hypothetical protein